MGMCKWFFKDASKIQNGRQRSTLNFFVGTNTLKLKVRKYTNFTITFPIWRCACDFFKVLLKFKMAATIQFIFFGGCKNSKKLLFFTITVQLTFFKWEGKAERGDDPGQLKKFRQGGHMGGFNKYLILGFFFHLTQLPVWITFIYRWGGSGWGEGCRANLIIFLPGGGGSKQIWTH